MLTTFVRAAWRVTPFKPQVKRLIYSRSNPTYWLRFGRACRILGFKYGLLDSMVQGASYYPGGEAIPWYTYPATEFLKQFDFGAATVFEYGCGNSTLFWGSRAKRVVSVEHRREWHDHMQAVVPAHVELIHAAGVEEYVRAVDRSPRERYDVIVIDGQSRLLCAKQAVSRLNDSGFIILDNSDWFPNTSQVLREAGLLEVDFFGFGPINDYTSATSLYFRRTAVLKGKQYRQPVPGIGSLPKEFDEAWWAP